MVYTTLSIAMDGGRKYSVPSPRSMADASATMAMMERRQQSPEYKKALEKMKETQDQYRRLLKQKQKIDTGRRLAFSKEYGVGILAAKMVLVKRMSPAMIKSMEDRDIYEMALSMIGDEVMQEREKVQMFQNALSNYVQGKGSLRMFDESPSESSAVVVSESF